MRFGKRGRSRSIGRREASKSSKKRTTAPVPQQGSVAPKMEEIATDSDVRTQEILTYLGHFSEQLVKTNSTQWSDTCMNDLIACMEITIEEGWGDLSKVLADTGRILQSYENVQRAPEAIPFLQDAYDVMCRIVGDRVIEKSTDESLENWAKVFSEGQEALRAKGLTLFEDDAAIQEIHSDALLNESSNEVSTEDTEDTKASAPKTLPVLGELPPLDSLVSFDSYVSKENVATDDDTILSAEDDSASPETNDDNVVAFASFDMPDADSEEVVEDEMESNEMTDEPLGTGDTVPEVTEEIENEEPVEQYDPPRIVVDIIDRICDVLGALEHNIGDARIASLKVMAGGLEALAHEALLMKSAVAQEACATMTKACQMVSGGGDEAWFDGLVEQGFAFCGVFIEALTNPDSENIAAWQHECSEWIDACTSASATPAQEESIEEAQEAVVEDSAPTAEIAEADEQDVFIPAPEAYTEKIVEKEIIPEVDIEASDKTEAPAEEAEIDFVERSQRLLKSAQEAALKGNAEEVKTFALRAAAEMAKAEVYKAETQLRECEIKLTQGIQNTEDSRESVKSCEAAVKESTNLVSESQEIHGSAEKSVSSVARKLKKLEAGVVDLNHQIQELQERRDKEQEKITETVEKMENSRQAEQQALSEWDELKVLEADSRQRLEEARQHVNDRQRMVQDIESSMESARETMTREKGSLNDITQTIQQLSGITPNEDDQEENTLLF